MIEQPEQHAATETNIDFTQETINRLVERVDFVVPARIAISNWEQPSKDEVHALYGFRSILKVDRSSKYELPSTSCVERFEHVPLIDGPGNSLKDFTKAVETLAVLAAEHAPVLVHCFAGASRSIAVVAGLLMLENQWTPEDAVGFVAARRYCKITNGLKDLLAEFADQCCSSELDPPAEGY
jgi:protein-tyrosine phosphatase